MSMEERDLTVARFISLFEKLKLGTGDSSADLVKQASEDSSIFDLCMKLVAVADELSEAELLMPQAYFRNANPAFIKSWRDFEERYREPLHKIAIINLSRSEDGSATVSIPRSAIGEEQWWKVANATGQMYQSAMLSYMFLTGVMGDEFRTAYRKFFGTDAPEVSAREVWETLIDKVGLDVCGAMRRRKLLPFTYVSEKISKRESLGKTIGLLANLEDAQKAFVFGAIRSAFGLMRSVLESVLRDHAGAEGKDLEDLLKSAKQRGKLPKGQNRDALYSLKKTANVFLHTVRRDDTRTDPFTYEWLIRMDEQELEKQFVRLYVELRSFVESVR